MRILFLTSRLPYPPTRGDRLRVFNFLRVLSQQHQITLLSFVEDEGERAYLANLRPYLEGIHVVHRSSLQSRVGAATRAWQSAPMQTTYYRSRAMQDHVDTLLSTGNFDLLYVHLFRMAPYAMKHRRLYRVLDLTDVISAEIRRAMPYMKWPQRSMYRVELPRIERYELASVAQFEETWVISETESRELSRLGAAGRTEVVPNGVDTERYHPANRVDNHPTLLFVGHLSVPHNEDAAEFLAKEILPLVRQKVPDIQLNLIGDQPSDRVRRLAALAGVRVLGHVPDLNRALNEATIFVAPLRFAAGVQNKVLEAMAAGTPVVTTSLVNAGLNATDGRELLVGDLASEIASHCIALLHDSVRRQELTDTARAFVETKYRWEAVVERVDQLALEIGALRGQNET